MGSLLRRLLYRLLRGLRRTLNSTLYRLLRTLRRLRGALRRDFLNLHFLYFYRLCLRRTLGRLCGPLRGLGGGALALYYVAESERGKWSDWLREAGFTTGRFIIESDLTSSPTLPRFE